MENKSLIYEVKDNIGWITLNRPEKLNAMNDSMLDELDKAFSKAEQDLDAKVVIVKGNGTSFSSGMDLSGTGSKMTTPAEPHKNQPFTKDLMDAQRRIDRRWEYIFNVCKPTIAQVQGYCLGTGAFLAMVCDFTIASEDALFGDPSVRMGLLSGMPLWFWLLGMKKSREMLFSGKYITGKEAEVLGLITQAVPAARLKEETRNLAEGLKLLHSDALALAKDGINAVMEARGLGAAWRLTTDMQLVMQAKRNREEDSKFFKTRDEKGLKKALSERDAPFKGFFD